MLRVHEDTQLQKIAFLVAFSLLSHPNGGVQDVEKHFTVADLRDLFTLKEGTMSDTHDQFKCKKCDIFSAQRKREQDPVVGIPGDFSQWEHYSSSAHLKVCALCQ